MPDVSERSETRVRLFVKKVKYREEFGLQGQKYRWQVAAEVGEEEEHKVKLYVQLSSTQEEIVVGSTNTVARRETWHDDMKHS